MMECDSGSSENLSRQGKYLSTVMSVVDLLEQFTTRMKWNLDDTTTTDAENVVVAIFNSLPVIGDIAALFSDDGNSFEDSVIKALENLSEKLQELSSEVTNNKDNIFKLEKVLHISIIQTQLANDESEIDSCFTDYENFLKNPSGIAEIYRMEICYDKITSLRDIGNVLKGQRITVDSKPLFVAIIDKRGYCNGTEISTVFKYLYGLYLKGCASLTMAERLKFNNSNIYLSECNTTNHEIFIYLRNLYSSCMSNKPCSKSTERSLIGSVLEHATDANNIFIELINLLPWYEIVLTVGEKISTDLSHGSSFTRIPLKDTSYNTTVLWWPNQDGYTTSSDSLIQMKITKCREFMASSNWTFDNNCSFTNDNETIATGHFRNRGPFSDSFVPCHFFFSDLNPAHSFSAAYIAFIAGGVLCVCIIIACVVCCCRGKCAQSN